MKTAARGFVFVFAMLTAGACSRTEAPAAPQEPGFDLSVSPARLSLQASDGSSPTPLAPRSGQVMVTIARRGGFEGPVAVSVSNLPDNIVATPLVIQRGANSGTITLTTALVTSPVTKEVSISAGGGEAVGFKLKPLDLTVFERADVEIQPANPNFDIEVGKDIPVTIQLKRRGGYAGPITLSAFGGPPQGITMDLPPSTLGNEVQLILRTSGSISPNRYSWVLFAKNDDGSVHDATVFGVNVSAARSP